MRVLLPILTVLHRLACSMQAIRDQTFISLICRASMRKKVSRNRKKIMFKSHWFDITPISCQHFTTNQLHLTWLIIPHSEIVVTEMLSFMLWFFTQYMFYSLCSPAVYFQVFLFKEFVLLHRDDIGLSMYVKREHNYKLSGFQSWR